MKKVFCFVIFLAGAAAGAFCGARLAGGEIARKTVREKAGELSRRVEKAILDMRW